MAMSSGKPLGFKPFDGGAKMPLQASIFASGIKKNRSGRPAFIP
jgi:hypothetical protein